jgi:hypothetical protein
MAGIDDELYCGEVQRRKKKRINLSVITILGVETTKRKK